jgi:hypothetical protein
MNLKSHFYTAEIEKMWKMTIFEVFWDTELRFFYKKKILPYIGISYYLLTFWHVTHFLLIPAHFIEHKHT